MTVFRIKKLCLWIFVLFVIVSLGKVYVEPRYIASKAESYTLQKPNLRKVTTKFTTKIKKSKVIQNKFVANIASNIQRVKSKVTNPAKVSHGIVNTIKDKIIGKLTMRLDKIESDKKKNTNDDEPVDAESKIIDSKEIHVLDTHQTILPNQDVLVGDGFNVDQKVIMNDAMIKDLFVANDTKTNYRTINDVMYMDEEIPDVNM